jgi:cytochrome c-type biogenesis protein CcmH/NrfF
VALHQSKIYRALGGDPRKLDAFCGLMESGKSARELMDWVVAESGAGRPAGPPVELSDQNITDFRQGHFARWRALRERMAAVRERSAAARQLVREARAEGASITDAAALSAAATISEALETFSAADLRASFTERPGDFFKAVGSLAQISRAEVARKELEQRAVRLESDLRLAAAREDELRTRTALVKKNLRAQVDALQRAIATQAGSAESRATLMQDIIATIDSL